jgi:DnaJ like chaperone protein
MSWWGKLIGGAFGFMLGGPLGALIGAAVGHKFDAGLKRVADASPEEFLFSEQERTQTAFFTATFSVMGYLAKADGRVTREELQVATSVMEQMNLSAELKRAAQRLFNEGKASNFPFNEVLKQFRHECHRNRNLVRMFIEIQLHAAYADGSIHPEERKILISICERLGIGRSEFDQLEALVRGESKFWRESGRRTRPGEPVLSLDDAYAMLNVSPDDSDAEVKRAYRRLMNRHHPDKLVAKGLPDEMMKMATRKTQDIKKAYERVKQSRRL